MHECPDCGSACDCDGEDTWWEDYPYCICCLGILDDEYATGENAQPGATEQTTATHS
jgi:hypothetical protein